MDPSHTHPSPVEEGPKQEHPQQQVDADKEHAGDAGTGAESRPQPGMATAPAGAGISPSDVPAALAVSAPSSASQPAAKHDAAAMAPATPTGAGIVQPSETGGIYMANPATTGETMVAMLQAVVAQQAGKFATEASPRSPAGTTISQAGTAGAEPSTQTVPSEGPSLDMLQSVLLAIGLLRSVSQGQPVAPTIALYAAQQLAAHAGQVQRLQQMHGQLLPLLQLQQQHQLQAAAAQLPAVPVGQGVRAGRGGGRGRGRGTGAATAGTASMVSEVPTTSPVSRHRGRKRGAGTDAAHAEATGGSAPDQSASASMIMPQAVEHMPVSIGPVSGTSLATQPGLASIVHQLMAGAPQHPTTPVGPHIPGAGQLLAALAASAAAASSATAAALPAAAPQDTSKRARVDQPGGVWLAQEATSASAPYTISTPDATHRVVTSINPALLATPGGILQWIQSSQQVAGTPTGQAGLVTPATGPSEAPASSTVPTPVAYILCSPQQGPGTAVPPGSLLSAEGEGTGVQESEVGAAEQHGMAPATE